jgi:ATP-binding protein involved in chromosome partitioning
MRFAIPLTDGVLCNHFGHCQQFAILDVEGQNVVQKEMITPPPHEPGLLPRWLHGLGVNVVIAGGMGGRALDLFSQNDIQVITGAPNLPAEALVEQHLNQTLQTGLNVCDH